MSEELKEQRSNNFIENIIEEDLAAGFPANALRFRFPPEPNGYLHLGHASSICLNFGLGLRYNAPVNLRFDDTNPSKEEQEYVDAIRRDVEWLGFKWDKECYASDYFQELYDWAVMLIKQGKAYVDKQTSEEIAAQKVVEGLVATLPTYLKHMKDSNAVLVEDIQRLSNNYLLSETDVSHVHRLQAELESLEESVLELTSEQEEHSEPYSFLEDRLENLQATLKEIEDEQVAVSQRLAQIEKDDINARQKANVYVNRLHTIKRYMEKRNLPGIPQNFLQLFFTASNHTEELMAELEEARVNIEAVNRMLEITTNDMEALEEETYNIVQYATLTEQLLQYSNRYRSFDERIQEAFNESLEIFEKEFDYHASFDKISQALEVAEPGVTNRFVTSYEKTRETIRF